MFDIQPPHITITHLAGEPNRIDDYREFGYLTKVTNG
jgi:hypothetical protein